MRILLFMLYNTCMQFIYLHFYKFAFFLKITNITVLVCVIRCVLCRLKINDIHVTIPPNYEKIVMISIDWDAWRVNVPWSNQSWSAHQELYCQKFSEVRHEQTYSNYSVKYFKLSRHLRIGQLTPIAGSQECFISDHHVQLLLNYQKSLKKCERKLPRSFESRS